MKNEDLLISILNHYSAYLLYFGNESKIPDFRLSRSEMDKLIKYTCWLFNLDEKEYRGDIAELYGVKLKVIE